jgi:predicted glycoside hydrolase/deacetylase ChbG (UPF0249 family)
MTARSVTVCADDFGMSAAIDHGIISLARSGRLSAVSVLAGGPTLREHIAALCESPVELGLHLNFTESFGRAGLHLPLPQLIARAYMHHLDGAQVQRQIERQLDAFEDAVGRQPDYVDGHQHVHQLPQIRTALVQSLCRRYAGELPWVRSTHAPAKIGFAFGLKAHVISGLGAGALARSLARHGLRSNRHLYGVYGFRGGATAYAALVRKWLGAMQGGDLLMCHPAIAAGDDPVGAQRVAEFDVLAGEEFAALLAAAALRAQQAL